MSSTEDKPRLGVGLPLGGTADPLNDPDGGFYENLPFHGMQNPPNKVRKTLVDTLFLFSTLPTLLSEIFFS